MIRRLLRIDFLTIGLLGIFAAICFALAASHEAHAATVTPGICRAILIFDRSGSVGTTGINTMRNQVQRLFQPTGLYKDTIELAFWSFASGGSGSFSYDSPGYGFVSSKGTSTGFNTALASLAIDYNNQLTNYEQGFGYNNDTQNAATKDIANKADIVVFMTDGKPNEPSLGLPGFYGDGNSYSVGIGRRAAKHYSDQGKIILGGLVGSSVDEATLAKVVNGDQNNTAHLFHISDDYSDLSAQLKSQVGTECDALNQPCPYNADISASDPECKAPESSPYSLTPGVTSTSTVISGSDSASFTYTIANNSTSTTSDDTTWSIKRLVVDRGQDVSALNFGDSESYRDSYTCEQLLALISNKGTCVDAGASGTRKFSPGTTTLGTADVGSAAGTVVDDDWQVGTKLCYVLTLNKPTQADTPTNRYSRAACVIVGKRPTFQVQGGDAVVGRYFSGDTTTSSDPTVRGSTTTKGGSVNKTFGSWVEYGIFAPGAVSGVASGSGFSGGIAGSIEGTQDSWSRLTFANTENEYGFYTNTSGMGMATNLAGYFIEGRTPTQDLVTQSAIDFNGSGVISGLYQKTNGNLTINASTLEKGKTVIVYVPEGTLTINGNLSYPNGPYSSMSELPQLILISPHIIINGSVANIDAWLIAQDSSGNGGTIDTCDQAPPLISETCNVQLRVNGPITAKQLNLRRTGGSGTGGASGDPAEIFNLRADAYLWAYQEGKSDVRAETTSTVELPPRF